MSRRTIRAFLTATVLFVGPSWAMPTLAKPSAKQEAPKDEKAQKVAAATNHYNTGVEHMDKAKKLWTDGDTTRARKEFENAANKYSKAIELHPDFPEALNNLGYSLRVTGRYEEALIHYNRAIELKPDFIAAHEYRARAFLALDRVKDAKAEYQYLLDQGEEEEAAELKKAIDAWVTAKAEGKKASVEKGIGW